jgi:DNA-binding response OmpR family regulator
MSAVLVVDDDPDIRTLLTIALERDGHQVEGAAGGTAGLAALRQPGRERPVVILDVQMPDLDGWEVLTEIRGDEELRDTPVILCTVKASAADLTRGWDVGCDAYVTKPFDINDMSSEVAALADLSPAELTRRRQERRLAL